MTTHPPPWTWSKGKVVSDAEATTACQSCDSCQGLAHFSCREGGHLAQGVAPGGTPPTPSYLPPALGAIHGDSSRLTLSRVMELLFHSNQPTLGTPLWPLKLICVVFFGFWGHLQSDKVYLSSQKLINNEQKSRYSVDPPHSLPSIHRHLESFNTGMPPQKSTQKGFWLYFPHCLLVHTLL